MLQSFLAALARALGTARSTTGQLGQTTAEYALVILGAAALATLLITWATKSHAITALFDQVIGKVLGEPMAARDDRPDWACPRERGQATVEFALVLPLIVFALLAILQVGLVVRDQVAVVHSAREAARAASVSRDRGAAAVAAHRVLARSEVEVGARPAVGESIRVEVTYHDRTDLPLVGMLFPDLDLHAVAVMRVER